MHFIFTEFIFRPWHSLALVAGVTDGNLRVCRKKEKHRKKKKGCSVTIWSLSSLPVYCEVDVYSTKIIMARQQIGSLSGNWDEAETCRGICKQQGSLRGRKVTDGQKKAQLESHGEGNCQQDRSWPHRSQSLCSQTLIILEGFLQLKKQKEITAVASKMEEGR